MDIFLKVFVSLQFSSEKCEECSVLEKDDELMLMDVQAQSGQQ